MKKFLWVLPMLVLSVATGCQSNEQVVNIYTDRHYETDQTLFDQFYAQTGIRVNVLKQDADPLITRLENERSFTSADLVFLADAGRLGKAKALDLLQPTLSEVITQTVPDHLQDSQSHWIGLTKRARVLVYHPDRVDPASLSTYEALIEPQWENRIVTRTSSNVYNQSLVAAMIAELGVDTTRAFTDGIVKNFAIRDALTGNKNPAGNDRDQAKAVYAGTGDVAIMNTYYLGRMLYSSDPLEQAVAETVRVFFPNQDTYGTHVNVSGVGLSRYAKNKENALRLVDFLLLDSSQRSFANSNFEYPINPLLDPHPLLASWGTFKEQEVSLSNLYTYTTEAYQLMIASGWN